MRDHGFAPSGQHMLPAVALQEMFMGCVDSMFKQRSRSELSLSVSPSKKEFAHLTNQQKSAVLVEFLSKKSVLQSLYDLMFLERLNHRATTTQLIMSDRQEETIHNHHPTNGSNSHSALFTKFPTTNEVLNSDSRVLRSSLNNFAVRN